MLCNTLTHDWERIGSLVRCWPCGKRVRQLHLMFDSPSPILTVSWVGNSNPLL